ncbi:hypothetical protein [Streptomyces bicolor]|uniref:hypothetical protein n=1 Tax=Streptomyces bicolor TaxID=66874 RepID=UPI0004E1345B|nr:hypothetical protein [Streptomyces bicolor]
MSGTDRGRETVERARALVPAGELLRADHGVALALRAPRPGYFRRPRALRSERRTLRSWLMLPVYGAARLYGATWNPVELLGALRGRGLEPDVGRVSGAVESP